MPTQNPRLTVTLKPSTYAQLQAVSRLTGGSLSSMIAEILEQSEPVFSRLIQVLTAAEKAKQDVRDRFGADLEKAQTKIEKQLGLSLGEFDRLSGELLHDAEKVRRRLRRVPSGASLAGHARSSARTVTPPSNRGVRSTANPQKTAKSKKGSTHGQV